MKFEKFGYSIPLFSLFRINSMKFQNQVQR